MLLSDTRPDQPSDPAVDLRRPGAVVRRSSSCSSSLCVGCIFPRRGFGRVDLLYQVAAAVGIGWLGALSVTFFVYRALEPPRLMLVYWALLSIVLVWLSRVVLDALCCVMLTATGATSSGC